MPKQKTRQYLLAKRRALSPLQVEELSHCIQYAFISSAEFADAKALALYAPIHNEVATASIMVRALAEGKSVLYPAVVSGAMVFRQVCDAGDLHEGVFGISEPKAYCAVYAPAEIDIFVIPGVAFDLSGRRIGYGKGYYDKTLHAMEGQGRYVGFCYDFQLLDEIAGEPHDVCMDLVISETRTIRP